MRVVVHPARLCNSRGERDARLASWPMASATAPHEGMAMRVPVGSGSRHRLTDLLPTLKSTPLEGERAQDLPSGLNQVEIGGIRGLEDKFPARMRQREEQDIGGPMRAQVVQDRVHALDRRINPALDVVEEVGPIDGGAARIGRRVRRAGGGLKGAEDVAALAPAVVDLLAGAPGGTPRLLTGGGPQHALPRPALGRFRPHLVETDHDAALRRTSIQRFYRPLFAANSGSTRAPNQVSCW